MSENKHVSSVLTFPSDTCLHAIFQREVQRCPDATALVFGSDSMTYAELDARSTQLASHLVQLGIQTEDFVAIYLERSFEMIIGIFGILKAGAAYVPIDVDYPKDRMAFMVEDCQAKVILTQSHLKDNLPQTSAQIISLDQPMPPIVNRKSSIVNPTILAYMIYTSGSTGKPKGCMLSHENLCNQLEGQQAIAPEPIGAMMLTCSISFDVSVLTIFWTLLQGAPLVLPKQGEEKDMAQLADTIHRNGVTHILTLPSLYTLLLEQAPTHKLQSLKLVNVSGEVCPTSLAQKHEQIIPNGQLYNLYGPTEATVNCTFFKFPKGFNEPKAPIGIPILNYEIFILDEKMQEVPRGEVGEIYIGGSKPVVGRGYWNRPELTTERFVNSKLKTQNSKLYKTGDLARWQPDGNIEFLGRSDFQVKFRGYRIELGEIEAAISNHPAVRETVVVLKNPHQVNEGKLVAYIVKNASKSLTISELRDFISVGLPDYMLPSHFVFLDKIPLTTNGKIDRKALPYPATDRPELAQAYEAPQGDLEKHIAVQWEELLQVSPIGRHDKFFELGGNSILAARFIGGLMTACEASIFITTIFDHPTVAGYAAFFEKNYAKLLPKLTNETVNIYNPTTGGAIENGRSPKLSTADILKFRAVVPKHLPEIVNSQSSIVKPPAPIFILAPPRSGTTLLRVMLAGHPGLFACNELQLLHFETLAEREAAYQGKFALWAEGLVRAVMELNHCEAEDAKLLLHNFAKHGMTTREMFEQLQEWVGDRLIVDKSPSYALDAEALEKALSDFPNARFIHLVRHPYSMVKSFEKYHMDQVLYLHPHDFSAQQLGELVWLESQTTTTIFLKNVPKNQQFRMVYEDLVQNPETVMRQMCEALEIPFHEGLLDPYKDLDKKMTDGIHRDSRSMGDTHFDQKKKIEAKKAEDWKGVLEDNFLCEATWNTAQPLGYELVGKLGGDFKLPPNLKHEPVKLQEAAPQSAIRNPQSAIAIIGMSCRLPGANNIEEFWQNLLEGKDVSKLITDADLDAEGIVNRKSKIVNRTYALDNPYAFDAAFFGYQPREAEMMDPQHRHFLETAYEALESAGYNPYQYEGNIGVFGGVARNTYALNNLLTNKELLENSGGWYQEMLASDTTFSISRVAYKLNLRGPAVNIQTACSTGGVSVHLACQSLLAGDSDMVIVGGGRVQAPVLGGYEHIEGGPLSADGYCRAFDEKANGMVQGHGMTMLVLKKLDKALEDGDHVWAVIRSTAINNDGSDKTGITAPSSKGQAAVIRKALEKAGLSGDQIGYVETHGTGTFIGDPIEIQGLMLGMRDEGLGMNEAGAHHPSSLIPHPCFIGSVKTNIGHLDAGACIVGIIKTALALYHEQLPATLHFKKPNPQLDFSKTPFEVNAELRSWKRGEQPRYAGVSSFGLGGTNAHIVLEEAPVEIGSWQSSLTRPQLLPLSTKTDESTELMLEQMTGFFQKNKAVSLADAAYTLATGRPHFAKRKALLFAEGKEKPELISVPPSTVQRPPSTVFMFPGGGAQYVGMARDLYETNAFFQQQVDVCFTILEQRHGLIIKDLVFPKEKNEADETVLQNPAAGLASLFTIEYALAKLWQHWGIQPAELIGHSMGEYTAACIAGVMSLEDALGLVTVRGKLFETLDGDGCMLSVAATEEKLRPFLTNELTISVINKVDSLVVSGTSATIDDLQKRLNEAGIDASKIHIKVPAHSPLIDPILPEFKQYLESVELKAPQIPIVSNVSGTWLTNEEATSVDYWLRHLRQTVRFADGLKTLTNNVLSGNSQFTIHNSQLSKNRIFLEVGPGQTLSTFARALPTLPNEARLILASVRHPKEVRNDVEFLLRTLGKLWVSGVDVDWQAFYEGENLRRVPLPTYPFERKKYFISPKRVENQVVAAKDELGGNLKLPPNSPATPMLSQPNEQTMSETNTSRIPNLVAEIKASLHELSGMEPAQMDASASFLELGFDSLFLSQAIIRFNQKFKLDLGFRVLFEDAPTIEALAEYVDGLATEGMFAPQPVSQPMTPKGEPNPVIMSQLAQQIAHSIAPVQFSEITKISENSTAVQQIINHQLQLMQQQLALLGSSAFTPTSPAPFTAASASVQAGISGLKAGGQDSLKAVLPASQEIEIQRNTKGVTAKLNSYKKISTGDDLSEKQRQGLQDFMRSYEAMTPKSKAMAQRHRQFYADPRSVTGFSKLWKEVCYQIAHERSKGSHIWDVDGNEYVDYVMSYGVALFGHMPDFVEKAAAAAIQRGNSIDLLPPEATEIARMICKMTGFDRVTLANTGTEAVLGAVRAARTATGREKIAVFDTDYHGMIDEFMVRGVHFKHETKSLPSSPGVPKYNVENVLVLDYDDPNVLQKLERHAGELAAVLIEPVQAQNPHWQHGELIKAIRKITENQGVALIFDEIINGFRLDQRGAQAWYGVDADICAYGKSISGGFPLAAVAGKSKYMNSFDGGYWGYGDDSSPEGVIAYFASTFIKNPISVAAAHAALSEIQRLGPDLQRDLNEKTARFAKQISEIFLRKKAPLMIQSASSFFMIKNADASPLTRLFNYVLRTKGINIRERPCFISTVHTEADFERTYKGFEDAIDEMMALGLMEAWHGEDLNVIFSPPVLPLTAKGEPKPEQQEQPSQVIELQQNRTAVGSPLGVGGEIPTTEGQQEIFLSDQFSPEASKAYNIATEIRLEGNFDEAKIRAALQALVDRHEALRTVFLPDGKTMKVLPQLQIDIPFINLSADPERISGLHNEEAEHLFDLQNGPLVRFKIVRLAEQVHLVFINVHHIICDGWSLGILTRELGEVYGAAFSSFKNLESLGSPKQLSQFATEQADLQGLPVFEKNKKYWLSQYESGVPVLDLPTDFPRPPVKTFNGAVEKISFDAEFTAQIRKAAAKQGSTFYVFMMAAYKAYLSRITGQDDIVFGVAAAGHNLPGNANLVAHAISLLPVRSKVNPRGEFKDFLKQLRKQVLDAFDHQQYTFGALVKKLKIGRNASRNTLVSVAFNLDSPLDDLKFGKLNATTRAIPRHYETFDTFINLKPLGSTIDFEWNFNTDLFRRESIQMRLSEFEVFLRGLVGGDAFTTSSGVALKGDGQHSLKAILPMSQLPLLPDFEKKQLEKFGRGEVCNDFPLQETLHGLFEKQVERTPDKTAVSIENQSLSYRELNDRANVLAAHLIEKGLQSGSFVGLCMERSLEMMVSIYAILKAGSAYVPIDPRNPQERIKLILEDAECQLVLTQNSVAYLLPEFAGEMVVVDDLDFPSFKNLESLRPQIRNPQSAIRNAYVIYTSGSTGTPKGVAISHANAINTLFAINKQLKMSELDVVFSVSSMAFDMSIPDYFLTMMTGATLILAGEETKKDGFGLRESLEKNHPTVMQATPTTWKILLMAGWEGDKQLRAIAGGEGFAKELAADMMHRCGKVWNGYGPTETTIYATWQLITEEHLATCPGEFAAIGSAIANVELLILDKNGEQVPVGVPGELYIGGNGVANGYLNRPELTKECFVHSSLIPDSSSLYKTGDLVRYLPTGEIEFLGRIDNQVKIRGYRVELGEIEETMKQFPGVLNCVVNVFSDAIGSQQLVGYVVENGRPLGEAWQDKLKDFLRSKMPGYMVPSAFIKMDSFPQNTSLKVDRKALPRPDISTIVASKYEAPKTPGEKLLVEVWSELLGLEKVGIHDDFFELGGHSLAAVQMMTKVKVATGKKLPLTTLFQHSTIHKLAGQLNGFNQKGNVPSNGIAVDNQGFTSLVPIREGGSKPALYLVHGGGLHVLFYQNMVKYMDADQPIYALQARGLNGDQEPLDRIEDMATHYISEILRSNPDGPFCLAGYSLGGIIAWEMAKQLKEQGREVLMLSLFDAVAKNEWSAGGLSSGFSKKLKKAGYNLSLMVKNPLNAFEYKTHVLKMQFEQKKGKLKTAFRNNKTNEIEEGYIPYGSTVYEKSIEAYENYSLQALDIQVDLFKAKEQMFYLHDPVHYGWDKFALGGVVTHEIEGNHLTLFDEPHGKQVAEVMKKRMNEIINAVLAA